MSAAELHQPSKTASRSGVARLVLALWLSLCALSLLLIALTIAFHLSTRYDWYFKTTFHPWRTLTVEAFAILGAPILGALIVWRRPGNRYGWVWCVLGVALAVAGAALAYELWALYVAPVQPRGLEAAWLAAVMQPLNLGLFPLLLLLFPDGQPPTPLAVANASRSSGWLMWPCPCSHPLCFCFCPGGPRSGCWEPSTSRPPSGPSTSPSGSRSCATGCTTSTG